MIFNFYLLSEIAIKFMKNLDNDQAFKFLIKRSNDEYYITMFNLGNFYERKDDIDTAIEYFQKALDNGKISAAEKLVYLNHNKKNESKAIMYNRFYHFVSSSNNSSNSNRNNNN